MALSAKDQEIVNAIKADAFTAWAFVHRFVWPALVGGIIIGAVLEHFVRL